MRVHVLDGFGVALGCFLGAFEGAFGAPLDHVGTLWGSFGLPLGSLAGLCDNFQYFWVLLVIIECLFVNLCLHWVPLG